ncbi:hypothetical protein [Paraburkholderia tropica]|uniref:hypothetical protein n=1 Tax=Paraburkholderia tropica TaxID=92647 RepID=UPI002AB6F744|nr:hypothetical protein [Paraburkholderia tropica]
MNPMHAAILAVVGLETKLLFDRDPDGACTLTQTDCDGARASVEAARHVLPSTVRHALLFGITGAQRWFVDRNTRPQYAGSRIGA